MSDLLIQPIEKPFKAAFTPPGSKSLTNRALVLAALCSGQCELGNVLFADDTLVMIDSLRKLGFDLQVEQARHTIVVAGQGGKIPASQAELFCGNSGTTIRFIAALCALGNGSYTLDGIARMRQRPIGQLVDLLKNAGVKIDYLNEPNFPPIQIKATGLAGGILAFPPSQSSQFLSAILMSAPYARHELQVDLVGKQTSWPYVAMTMQLMDHFGHTVELERDEMTGEPTLIVVPQGTYRCDRYVVEPDASNASYFLAAAAIHKGSKITIEGLGKRSLQGDVGFADVLHKMGASLLFGPDFITIMGTDTFVGVDVDLSEMPDTAQTLAVAALFAKGPTTIRGLHTLRVKETDRLAALETELTKLGAKVEIEDDVLIIDPPAQITPAQIDTYDDHRMAMSFAIAGTRSPGITIKDVECVNKTYPDYFADLEKVIHSV